jgi:hypothetical protein
MAHSHDRTLIASLGFADPDKHDQMHDLACEFLAEPTQAERIVRFVEPQVDDRLSTEASVEVAISKGEGQYRTTIGFIDVQIEWERPEIESGLVVVEVKIGKTSIGDIVRQFNLYREYVGGRERGLPVVLDRSTFQARLRAMRTTQASGQASGWIPSIRMAPTRWVLAHAFDLDAGQVDTLKRESVHPIRLGAGFSKWFEERAKREPPRQEQF